jgi:hypothetical protein
VGEIMNPHVVAPDGQEHRLQWSRWRSNESVPAGSGRVEIARQTDRRPVHSAAPRLLAGRNADRLRHREGPWHRSGPAAVRGRTGLAILDARDRREISTGPEHERLAEHQSRSGREMVAVCTSSPIAPGYPNAYRIDLAKMVRSIRSPTCSVASPGSRRSAPH